MSRIYTVTFENVLVAAAQDLFQIGKAGDAGRTTKLLKLLRVKLSATDTTIPTSQMLMTRIRTLPATLTDGSGGSTAVTPNAPGEPAASFVACTNNTTKATTTGTPATVMEDGFHVYNGWDENTDVDGRARSNPLAFTGQTIVVELLSTPSGTLHLSGTAWVEEIG